MTKIRRRPVAFNEDDMLEKGLSDWCDEQSPDNFSGFIKKVLFAYKNGMVQALPAAAAVGGIATDPEEEKRGLMSIL
ncbi:hypothetical protein ACFSVM_25560 [Paenibacillus shunpengii]|uniref:Uncharacterized protein n=1 Tax=Paenibacillus shunpengii TaxID=2054424 RepID=A0ABW5SW40_9BACL